MPSSRDWFRSTAWDDSVAAEFERRLRRARPRNRAQYVRVQAVHLSRTDDDRLHDVARSLFRRVIEDFPDDPQVKSALELLARMLAAVDEHAEAEELLRRLVGIIDTSPNGISGTSGNVELALAEVIIAAGDKTRLGEASSWLDRHSERLNREAFYDMHFRHHLARARIAVRLYAADAAADHARSALEWADRTVSPFANHPDLGFANASSAQRSELDRIIRSAQGDGAPP